MDHRIVQARRKKGRSGVGLIGGGKEQVIPLFCSRIAEHNCTKQFNFRLPLLFEILKITKIVFHVPPLEPFEHCMRSGLSPEPSVTLLPGAG